MLARPGRGFERAGDRLYSVAGASNDPQYTPHPAIRQFKVTAQP
jgi:hypothetical protein